MSFRLIEHPGGDPRVPWTMLGIGTVTVSFSEESPLVVHESLMTTPVCAVMDWLLEYAAGRYRLCSVTTSASVPAIIFKDYATAFAFKLRWDGVDDPYDGNL
jgi:hypothetical protein